MFFVSPLVLRSGPIANNLLVNGAGQRKQPDGTAHTCAVHCSADRSGNRSADGSANCPADCAAHGSACAYCGPHWPRRQCSCHLEPRRLRTGDRQRPGWKLHVEIKHLRMSIFCSCIVTVSLLLFCQRVPCTPLCSALYMVDACCQQQCHGRVMYGLQCDNTSAYPKVLLTCTGQRKRPDGTAHTCAADRSANCGADRPTKCTANCPAHCSADCPADRAAHCSADCSAHCAAHRSAHACGAC